MTEPRLQRVLLVNDDGFDAPGLRALEDVAAEFADEVWVVAPSEDQSGSSHAISLQRPLRVHHRGGRRYAVTGSPGDCAAIGIAHVMAARPDLVLSGINSGINMGGESAFSGTLGGAMTALLLGVKAIAISQQVIPGQVPCWSTAEQAARLALRHILNGRWDGGSCLNVNLPHLPREALGPIAWGALGAGRLRNIAVDTRTDPGGHDYHWLRFERSGEHPQPDAALDAFDAGAIHITPLRADRTDWEALRGQAEPIEPVR